MRKTRFSVVLLLCAALMMSACRATRRQRGVSRSDTSAIVTVTERIRDTVVKIEADSAMLRALIECDSLGQAHIRELLRYRSGQRVEPPQVEIRDNVLTATARIDSQAIYLALKDRYVEKDTRTSHTEVRTVEVNRLTWWQKLWCRLGQILFTAGVILGGCKLYKLIKTTRP